MSSAAHVIAFAGVVAAGAMAPGPDLAIVMRQSVVAGRRAGMVTALGIGLGIFAWVLAAVLGVAALLAASALAFTIVKIVGAVYLVYLGVRALRSAARRAPAGQDGQPPRAVSAWAGFRQGLLTNLLNPKAAAFFIALVPQFLPGDAALGDTLLLSGVAMATAVAWFLLVANLVAVFRRVFARDAVRRGMDAVMGTALVALGVRLAVTR
ncbi:LysE family translocator [Bailinhaonella thermotolerans]|uniref:LysE family translocator n=1 Tax=Bailinhaonella thermotolerans TaxID=1070861 RepID=A0A3A4A7U4_9ACTN|nr:LysE family translocator [Bailinhaonella thermotolerans]RJL23067.1 LysE family translocator [Bailinhaonella thermotolerans]